MVLDPQDDVQTVRGLGDPDVALIRAFMQGAVYCWAKNRPEDPFAVRDLVGGANNDWSGTPLQVLYDRQVDSGKTPEEAAEQAAVDLGRITKSLLSDDRRTFRHRIEGQVRTYQWVGNEP